jgi:hypothetical protein
MKKGTVATPAHPPVAPEKKTLPSPTLGIKLDRPKHGLGYGMLIAPGKGSGLLIHQIRASQETTM